MEAFSYQLPVFEGPLDLLLHLIAKNKLTITDISICDLLDQYMAHIRAWQENEMEVASEFLEMASRLVYLKSAYLLPRPEEAEQLNEQLTDELLAYQACRQLAQMLSGRTDGFDRFVRPPTQPPIDPTYALSHEGGVLVQYYLAAVGRGRRRLPPPEAHFTPIVKKAVISVASRITVVLRRLWNGQKIKAQTFFSGAKSRSEAVATFLAVLELIRERRIRINEKDELSMVKGEDRA